MTMLRKALAAFTALLLFVGSASSGGISNLPVGSTAFDQAFGSTVGTMLCRTSSGWGLVATGSANQVLTVPSAGGCPTWAAAATVSAAQDGCVRVSVASTTTLTLAPRGCSTLVISSAVQTVTSVTVTPTVAASTLYYAYASVVSGAVTLTLSTTGHVTGSDGREYLSASGSANTAYRLVGMVYTNASSQFVDSTAWRGCLNWFNRRALVVEASGSTSGTTTAAVTSYTSTFLSWLDEASDFGVNGNAQPSAGGVLASAFVSVDGASKGTAGEYHAPGTGYFGNVGTRWSGSLTEGQHTFAASVNTNTGTATFSLDLVGLVRG